jgi:putative intracellular protease/amidase
MGALNTAEIADLLEQTPKLADLDLDEYDALVVCGGQGPMFQFRDHEDLQRTIAAFYEAEKPTAALCHGVSGLLDVKLSDGSRLIEGKTITGFANVEEDFGDAAVGQRVMPFRIEDEARERGANYVQAGLFKAFAIRDNQLITGQQQYSGAKVAQSGDRVLGGLRAPAFPAGVNARSADNAGRGLTAGRSPREGSIARTRLQRWAREGVHGVCTDGAWRGAYPRRSLARVRLGMSLSRSCGRPSLCVRVYWCAYVGEAVMPLSSVGPRSRRGR